MSPDSIQTRIAVPNTNYVVSIRGPWVLAEFREQFGTRDDYARLVLGDLDHPHSAVVRFRQALDQLDAAARELIAATVDDKCPF
jgi:hypothetical protein